MLSPASLTRESITCVFSSLQNGQCISYAATRHAPMIMPEAAQQQAA
jgi:hypothetical protein